MINDYFFLLFIFSLLNEIQTLPLVQQKPNRYSYPDHYTDVLLNFKLNNQSGTKPKQVIKKITETSYFSFSLHQSKSVKFFLI